jgi:GNAT superfamily N-acetyltransferase
MKIRLAEVNDSPIVATLILELVAEVSAPGTLMASTQHLTAVARALLSGSTVWALLAESDAGEAVGVLTLNECAAICAGGRFGEISEMYVRPSFRSQGIGENLVGAAVEFGRSRKWTRLEVGAPPVPPWARSSAFYRRNGFEESGPRLKLALRSSTGKLSGQTASG